MKPLMLLLSLAFALTSLSPGSVAAQTVTLTDGVISLDVSGTNMNEVVLGGLRFTDPGFFFQGDYIGNNNTSSNALVSSTATSAVHSVSRLFLDYTVATRIVGTYPGVPGSRVVERVVTLTADCSTTSCPTGVPAQLHSLLQTRLSANGGDTLFYDAVEDAQAAFDANLLVAMTAESSPSTSSARGLVAGSSPSLAVYQSANGVNGPITAGPSEIGQVMEGFTGNLADGETRELTYVYLFAPGIQTVPPGFGQLPGGGTPTAVPGISPWSVWLIPLLGSLAFFARRAARA